MNSNFPVLMLSSSSTVPEVHNPGKNSWDKVKSQAELEKIKFSVISISAKELAAKLYFRKGEWTLGSSFNQL